MRTLRPRAALAAASLLALASALGAAPALAQGKKKSAPPAAKGPAAAKAEAAEKPATPAKLELVQVNDRRSSGSFAGLMLHVVLPDVPEKDVFGTRVVPKTATDDLGQSLVKPDSVPEHLMPTATAAGFARREATPSPLRVSFDLASPARNASSVKEVAGEIELYLPGKDPNAIASIPKAMAGRGKPIAHAALRANGVEITLLSPAQVEAEKKRLAAVKRAEAKKDGLLGEMLEQVVEGFVSMLFSGGSEMYAKVKDPKKRLHELAFVKPDGEVQRVMTREEHGLTILNLWGEPPADASLRVTLLTPASRARYTFTLRDVPLP